MFHTAPAASRVVTGSRSRALSHRFARPAARTSARRSPSLHETLAVGLGLTQRP